VETVRIVDDRFVFSFEWGRASEALLMFGFGRQETFGMVSRISGPIIVMDHDTPSGPLVTPRPEARFKRTEPGYYLAVFYEGDRVIGAEGSALPPLDRFP
jgi:hypothetical protein